LQAFSDWSTIMKKTLGALVAALGLTTPMAQAADVGVSVQIGQPGFYGRIDIGRFPQPQVVYPQPIVIAPAPVTVVQAPLYLRVPPGHAKKWDKHCYRYNACNQPVYFVQDQWYQSQVAQVQYVQRGEPGEGRGHGHGKGHGRGHRDD
jgi:hypothetical protein